MVCNSNDENKITYFSLMANEGVDNWDTSDNDDDNDAYTSDDEEQEGKLNMTLWMRYMILLAITLDAS